MASMIIPFGKYKGREIEDIKREDDKYMQWLIQQNFFKEKFEKLYLAYTNLEAPKIEDCTPVHNKMQADFSLDDSFCLDVVAFVFGDRITKSTCDGFTKCFDFASGELSALRDKRSFLSNNTLNGYEPCPECLSLPGAEGCGDSGMYPYGICSSETPAEKNPQIIQFTKEYVDVFCPAKDGFRKLAGREYGPSDIFAREWKKHDKHRLMGRAEETVKESEAMVLNKLSGLSFDNHIMQREDLYNKCKIMSSEIATECEYGGKVDVKISAKITSIALSGYEYGIRTNNANYILYLELKPFLGDDYPNCVRQCIKYMKEFRFSDPGCFNSPVSRVFVIVVGQWNATSVTFAQFKQICEKSGIMAVMQDEFERGAWSNLCEKIRGICLNEELVEPCATTSA